MATQLTVRTLEGLPIVRAGDDLSALINDALARSGTDLNDGDVVVVAQKIVSLAEGRLVRLDDVQPSAKALELAAATEKDARIVELMLAESADIVRTKPGVIIARHRLGIVGANAGIDQSNIDHADGECALLLPEDPDKSARRSAYFSAMQERMQERGIESPFGRGGARGGGFHGG